MLSTNRARKLRLASPRRLTALAVAAEIARLEKLLTDTALHLERLKAWREKR